MRGVPPPALTKEEFERRQALGAETMEELDPKLFEWLTEADRVTWWKWWTLTVVVCMVLVTALLAMCF